MAGAYRLRVTLSASYLILEYLLLEHPDQQPEQWALAGLHSFARPLKATTAFRRLQKHTAVPNVIRDKFKEWGSEIPAELEADGVVLIMSAHDFVFSGS